MLAKPVLDSGRFAPPLNVCSFGVLTSVEEGHGSYGVRVHSRPVTALVPEAEFFSDQAGFKLQG